MAYKSANLSLQSQSIAGPRHWSYQDTGSTPVVVAGAAFFADGKEKGMQVGDIVFYANNGATPTADRFVVTAVQAQDTGVQFAEVGDTG